VLLEAKLTNVEWMGIGADCIKLPDPKTITGCHSTLMLMPEVMPKVGIYKPEHRPVSKTTMV
jgi:hypothetical protein